MNMDVTGEARAAWRRRLAALALRRLQMPLDLPSFRDAHGERVSSVDILRSMFAEGRPDPEAMLDEADRYFSLIGSPEADRMSAGLRDQVRELRSGRYAESSLREDLGRLWEADQERLEALPPGPDKARGYLLAHVDVGRVDPDRASYEAMCFLRDEVEDDAVTEVIQGWKEAVRAGRERGTFEPDIFWGSRAGEYEMDAIAHYRFIEVFDVGEFPGTVQEIERGFREGLMMPQTWVDAAENLWLVSRSGSLRARLRPFIEEALALVCEEQSAGGWWPRWTDRILPENEPGNRTTALACVAVVRTSRDERQLERAREGARWLAQQQEASGAWRQAPAGDARAREEELNTTLLAGEAIRALGAEGYGRTLAAAEAWIRGRQDPAGKWDGPEALDRAFMTAWVLEYLEGTRPSPAELSDYLSIARDFASRAQSVSLENNANAWRLSVVVAFQGIEAFLYACLEHPSVNVPFFEGNNRNRTIGMVNALERLEEKLRGDGRLSGQSVPFRNSLDRIAYLRNEVVHKGASVGREDARRLSSQAERFMSEISARVFGFSIS